MNAIHRRSCLVHIASPLFLLQGPRHDGGRGEGTHSHRQQSGDSSGKKEAHSHSNCTKPRGCPERFPSNSSFIHLELKPLQASLSSGTSRRETNIDRRKLVGLCAQRAGPRGRRWGWAWMLWRSTWQPVGMGPPAVNPIEQKGP